METLLSRDDAVAREWQTLSRKLSHARGFCLVVYFVGDQRIAIALKRQLSEQLQRSGGELRVIAADEPESLVASSMGLLFTAPAAATTGAPGQVVWFEAFRGAGRPEWDGPREQLLMRLNERRSRLEAELRAPLVLLLPADAQRAAATLAPDLWHVRVHSAALQAAAAAERVAPRPGNAAGITTDEHRIGDVRPPPDGPEPADVEDDEPRAVAYWRQQTADPAPDDDDAPGATSDDPGAAGGAAVWDGFDAIAALLDQGRIPEAQRVADDVLRRAQALWHALPTAAVDRRAMAERAVAQAWGLVGTVANRQRRFADAAAALRQAVQQLQALLDAQGRTQTNVSLLAAQLDELGRAHDGLGQLDAAIGAYREALAHHRWLSFREIGADQRALSAVAPTLLALGDVQRRCGDWDAAGAAFAEALQLLRGLQPAGDGPASRRALAQALFGSAEVAEHQGRLDAAASAWSEALAISRRLLAETGETPQTFEIVAATLDHLARLDGLSPERQQAAAAEALQLRQRLAHADPGVELAVAALQSARQTVEGLPSTVPQTAP